MALIVEGYAVDRTHVEEWFPQSPMVAVARSGADIVGVGAIKPPRPYTKRVAERSGFDLDPQMHELGYITVREDHRGRRISHAIVQALDSEHEAPLFATTSSEAMKRTLRRFRFEPRGTEWTRRGSVLSLWVRE